MLAPAVALIVTGGALAGIAAKAVAMQGSIERAAADRRQQESDQMK